MNNLILLTNGYPYGTWETYLETEVQYLERYFDNIYLCSLQVRKEHKLMMRKLPSGKFKVCRIDYAPRYIYLLNSVRVFFDINFYRELQKLVKDKRFSYHRFVKLVVFITRAHYEANKILRFINKNGLEEKTGIIYSYRFEYQPYVGILIQKKYPNYQLVTRAHGTDLFEERNKDRYIPMRQIILRHINKVYLIADDGRKYLNSKYPGFAGKLRVSRLGTKDYGLAKTHRDGKQISIVSCSAVVKIKRIDLIIKALSVIKDYEVTWTHFGEGPLLNKMKALCDKILPANVHYRFRGFVPNQKVLEEYAKGNYHLFLNVSVSEGVPVSIMEVMSFGIPCIATDVGGTAEIITTGENGILLDADFKITELSHWICRFADMDEIEYQRYRNGARRDWQEKYNADRNYREFCEEITQNKA